VAENGFHIEKASPTGFCSGVRRAVTVLERTATERGPLQTLGPAVHNRQVVEKLAGMGVTVAAGLDKITGTTVAISSHGASPATLDEVAKRGLQLVDTTCPIVHRAQVAAKRLAKAGFLVVIFGDAEHPEVKGLLGWAGARSLATTNARDLTESGIWPRKLGVLSQTTQNAPMYIKFVKDLIDMAGSRFTEISIINTICGATQKRQMAAARLARRTDLMIVVGGWDSSNTRRLAEICQADGVETHQIETAGEIDAGWLKGKRRVGVTAGASTADSAVDEVVARLRQMSGGEGTPR